MTEMLQQKDLCEPLALFSEDYRLGLRDGVDDPSLLEAAEALVLRHMKSLQASLDEAAEHEADNDQPEEKADLRNAARAAGDRADRPVSQRERFTRIGAFDAPPRQGRR